jgi:hypothetical protein
LRQTDSDAATESARRAYYDGSQRARPPTRVPVGYQKS